MTTNYINKSVLGLMAAVAISANLSQAGQAPGDGSTKTGGQGMVSAAKAPPSHDESSQALLFQNLVTDDAALEAWNAIKGKQAEVNCESNAMPLREFVRKTGNVFSNQFDIIWPSDDRDPNSIALKMRLMDVRAIEIFNAMNLYFEAQTIPARWKLALNGNRPTAILVIEKNPFRATASALPERKHTVFSIAGPLYASGPANYKQAAASMTEALEAVLDDISDTPRRGPNGELREDAPIFKIHAEAAILVFTGTAEETELMHSALGAFNDSRLHKGEVLQKEQKEQKANAEAGLKAEPLR